MGILKPYAGSVRFGGAPITMIGHERAFAGIGCMRGARHLVPHLTVRDNALMQTWDGRRAEALHR